MMLVIDRKNTTISHKSGVLTIEQAGQGKQRIPLRQIEQCVIHGNPLIEAAACRALAEAGIPTLMLPGRGTGQPAMLSTSLATAYPLRQMQYRSASQPEQSLQMAKWFVQRKIDSQSLATQKLQQIQPHAQDAIESLQKKNQLARQALANSSSLNTIMGIEGSSARSWFDLLASHLPSPWAFHGRNRRPPRDPINAMLSLGYTLLNAEIRQQLLISGFDLSLGFLHQPYPGREALVLDFVEIFRSGVDALIFDITHQKHLTPKDFYYREKEGCRLSKAARPHFYNAWAAQLEAWPRPLHTPSNRNEPWPQATLQEQIGGQIAAARQYMQTLQQSAQPPENSP